MVEKATSDADSPTKARVDRAGIPCPENGPTTRGRTAIRPRRKVKREFAHFLASFSDWARNLAGTGQGGGLDDLRLNGRHLNAKEHVKGELDHPQSRRE
jgi:hypothetical protein